ncbi:hypothetical protein [Halomonas chromatireducens]|uniref:Uncharacterized protein n=1 Tax=Halomonas chromatireducens TaxID=507626 RepID=A0A0X8HCJ1_9GAMM|nr:hypothetical protein [Halomonas chromatireducens]AMD00116.1 hypothetical protein LOKO_01039 [Halomonas chromatireducens]
MLKWLTGKQPIPVWVIKQIDDGLLHLCGQAIVEPQKKRSVVLMELHERRFQGAVNMASGGLVLNSRLFAALVPLDALELDVQAQAHWQGRTWLVSQVPQRCWTFEGPLITQRQRQDDRELLVSCEDISDIRRQVKASLDPSVVTFGSPSNEHPLIAPRDGKHIDGSYDSRKPPKGRGWRGDDN